MMPRRFNQTSLDGPAAAALYERYATAIFTYLRRRVSTQEDAEDLLLEVFLAAFERNSLLTLTEGERSAWLWQVARNKLADYYRHTTRRATLTLDDIEALCQSEAAGPEQVALRHDEEHRLRAAIQQLPPLQQEVLHLRFGLELRCAQIAERLGKSEGAIRVTLLRALKRLRSLYEESSEEDAIYGTRR